MQEGGGREWPGGRSAEGRRWGRGVGGGGGGTG